MFDITLIVMGKLKEKFYLSAAEEYQKRLKGYCSFKIVELPEHRLPEDPSPAELGARAKNDEDVLSYIAFPQVAKAFFEDRAAGFPKKEPAKKEPAKKEPEKKIVKEATPVSNNAIAPMPEWQGHVYYTNVAAPVSEGYTTRAIQPFAASYQPPHLMMGNRGDCSGTYTVTINGKIEAPVLMYGTTCVARPMLLFGKHGELLAEVEIANLIDEIRERIEEATC